MISVRWWTHFTRTRWQSRSFSSRKNVTTGIQVAQARGVILLALAQKGLHPVSYTPNQVKLSVVGYGGAEKKQVMEMTKSILHLTKLPRPDDAADALALAICHGHSRQAMRYEGLL
mgnify:CR=1 FL=1